MDEVTVSGKVIKVGDEIKRPVKGRVSKFVSDGKTAVVIDTEKKTRYIDVTRIEK